MQLSKERIDQIGSLVNDLLVKHPDQNSQYSPHQNPLALTIERFKAEVDPEADITPQELHAWCEHINELVPLY